jgi:hypothetical protein
VLSAGTAAVLFLIPRPGFSVTLVPGGVRVIGGAAGPVRPALGEEAVIVAWPTSAGTLRADIYTSDARPVRALDMEADGTAAVGLRWDGRDSGGAPVPPGVYRVLVSGPGLPRGRALAVLVDR